MYGFIEASAVMSCISNMGLPQGLPELSGYQSALGVGYQNCQLNQPMGLAPSAMADFVAMVRKTCQCNQCAAYRGMGGIGGTTAGYLPPPHDGKGYVLRATQHREMTAADLGLYTFWRRTGPYSPCDAPYSFWLGADA